jgi:phosphonate transport system permease protein
VSEAAHPLPAESQSFSRPRSRRSRAIALVVGVAVVALFVHAWQDTQVSLSAVASGFHNTLNLLARAVPPSGSVLTDSIRASVLTFDTALLGTAAALVLSLLLVPFAARNITPHRLAYEGARLVIGVTRAIPDFVFALIFLVAVGLGPFSVVLAIAAHTIGVLGKLFSEAVEDMDMGPVDALRASGASRTQVFVHAIIPSIAATFTSLALYRLDTNVRSVLYLGAIGGGGLGFLLYDSLQLFQYRQVTTELAVLLVLLLVVERASLFIRERIL